MPIRTQNSLPAKSILENENMRALNCIKSTIFILVWLCLIFIFALSYVDRLPYDILWGIIDTDVNPSYIFP